MKQNFFSGLMAGAYISLGAMTFLIIPNQIVASLFFATGVFLVFNFSNMLFTRVCPLMAATKEYHLKDQLSHGLETVWGLFSLLHSYIFADLKVKF